jgi:hypothetical protein
MDSTHLHCCVLRYTPRNRPATINMVNVVQTFLTTRVQYVDNIDDFLTCRRNGQAHLEADYSVDTIGHIEAAIFGAAAGLKEWHYLQHSAAVARAQQ